MFLNDLPGRTLTATVLLAAVMIAPQTAIADDEVKIPGAPHLLPDDTLAYIRVDNADELREQMDASSIGKMLSDPKMKPFASDIYQTMDELFGMISSQLGVSLDELLSIPSGQVCAAAMPGILPEPDDTRTENADEDDESPDAIRRRIARKRRQQNAIAGMFMIDAGKNVDKLLTLIERLEEQLLENGYVRRTEKVKKTQLVRLLPPRQGRPEIEYFERDDVVVFGIGHQTAGRALDHWLDQSDEPTLADNADFASVMSRCVGAEDTRPQSTFFLDPYHLVERIVKRGGAAGFVWPIIEELGIAKIRGIGGSAFSGGDEFEDITHLHVLIDPPRDGFFGVLRPESGETQPPNFIPHDVTTYTSIHWNYEATYDNFDKILAKFQGEDPMKRFVEDPMKKEMDIDLRKEIIENLTGRYVSCNWMQRPIKINSQSQAHALELSDPVKAKNVIAKMRAKDPDEFEAATIGGRVVYLNRRNQQRRDNFPKGLRRPEPCFMILGDYFIFADSRELMERIVQANSGAIKQLKNVPEYELMMAELGGKLDGEKPFLVSFARVADYFQQMYELAKSDDTSRFLRNAGEENPVAQKVYQLLERNELPPFSEFKKYFAPSGSFAYDEPTGMHMASFTLKGE